MRQGSPWESRSWLWSVVVRCAPLFCLCLCNHETVATSRHDVVLNEPDASRVWSAVTPQHLHEGGYVCTVGGDMVVGPCEWNPEAGRWVTREPVGWFGECCRRAARGRQPHTLAVVTTTASSLWPHATVPYAFSSSASEQNRLDVADALALLHAHTVVRFVPRTTETDFVLFTSNGPTGSCSSFVGRTGGAQFLWLRGSGCGAGTTLHELLHALGFLHEHQRRDRDDFVQVAEQCVPVASRGNFAKCADCTGLGPYDYNSIMQYSRTAFANTSCPSILPVNSSAQAFVNAYGPMQMGQRQHLSPLDVQKVNQVYDRCWGPSPFIASTAGPTGTYAWQPGQWSSCGAVCGAVGRERSMFCVVAGSSAQCVNHTLCRQSVGAPPPVWDDCRTALSCDFEDTLCGWSLSAFAVQNTNPYSSSNDTADFAWTRARGASPSDGTGPTADHTRRDAMGVYLLMEASLPHRPGDRATLMTPVTNFGANASVSFWFHLFGAHVGSLNVVLVPCAGAPLLLLSLNSTNTGSSDQWRFASVAVPPALNASLHFVGEVGISFRGDIGLDDVTVNAGSFAYSPAPGAPATTVPTAAPTSAPTLEPTAAPTAPPTLVPRCVPACWRNVTCFAGVCGLCPQGHVGNGSACRALVIDARARLMRAAALTLWLSVGINGVAIVQRNLLQLLCIALVATTQEAGACLLRVLLREVTSVPGLPEVLRVRLLVLPADDGDVAPYTALVLQQYVVWAHNRTSAHRRWAWTRWLWYSSGHSGSVPSLRVTVVRAEQCADGIMEDQCPDSDSGNTAWTASVLTVEVLGAAGVLLVLAVLLYARVCRSHGHSAAQRSGSHTLPSSSSDDLAALAGTAVVRSSSSEENLTVLGVPEPAPASSKGSASPSVTSPSDPENAAAMLQLPVIVE